MTLQNPPATPLRATRRWGHLPSPPRGQFGLTLPDPALPALFQCLNDQPGHSSRIGGRHAAEADIHRRRPGIQKSLERRGRFLQACLERGLLLLGCGFKAIRFLPPLDVTERELDLALEILSGALSLE